MARGAWKLRVVATAATVACLGLLAQKPAASHVRAASLLLQLAAPAGTALAAEASGPLLYPVREEREASAFTREGGEPVPARYYVPTGVTNPPGVVLVHGVHRLGIEEPRLERFARSIAAAGVLVMTPGVRELSDYRVHPRSIDVIGGAVRSLRETRSKAPVGLMGTSFGGGLAMLTAADARYRDDVGFVVSVGGHHDLARVMRFFVTDEVLETSGELRRFEAHPYGALVFFYAYMDRFVAPGDLEQARDVTRLWLWDETAAAKKGLELVPPELRATLQSMFDGKPSVELRARLRAEVAGLEPEMARVSPRGRLDGLRAPVFLLHGKNDPVVPVVEAEWAALEAGPAHLGALHVSPAMVHVELDGEPELGEKLALVGFMAEVLEAARALR